MANDGGGGCGGSRRDKDDRTCGIELGRASRPHMDKVSTEFKGKSNWGVGERNAITGRT